MGGLIMHEIIEKKSEHSLISWGTHEKQTLLAFSLQGKSHSQSKTPLQDNHALRFLPNGWSIAVVCDGVGSKPHADDGSQLAANAFADFFVKYFGSYQDENSIYSLLICAAHYATGEMYYKASLEQNNIHDYNTTLHAAVFANGLVYYFHSGDGGIIVLTKNGIFERLTEPHKDEQYVIPLLSGPNHWEVGKSKDIVQSVLLCTDGVYDKLSGAILRKYGEGIDKGLCTFFMNPWCFDSWNNPESIANKLCGIFSDHAQPNDLYPAIANGIAQGETDNIEAASIFVRDYIYYDNYPLTLLQGIQDDITVAIIQNTAMRPAKQPMEYFKGPDWEALRKRVYDGLYG